MDFVGAGWAFPLRTDATGGIALVAREREIEEAIRLILGTAPGERPMRPEFGCRIHDHVFAPANAATAGAIAYDVRAALERGSRGSTSTTSLVSFDAADAGALYIDITLRDPRHQRPAQPGLPVLRDPRSTSRRAGPASPPLDGRELTMVLPAPNLDDRDFQDLVDDAKRLVQQRCPEWTDHNVSDPGVTLIEAFAQMVDQLIYRLNRVPDRNYVKFLELIGVELLPAGRRPRHGHVLAVGAAAADRRWSAPGPRWRRRAPTSTSRSSSPPSRTWRSCRASSPLAAVSRRRGRSPTTPRLLAERRRFACFSDVPVRRRDAC